MHSLPLLDELAIIAAVAVLVTVLLSRMKLPTVAGLLAAGALLGPHGLALVRSVAAIEVLAEIGVVLLLFSIGLEFSLARLRDIFRQVALGGALQVGMTTAATALIAAALGQSAGRAVFYGFVVALSSTAIVLRVLGERRELDAPHGRFIVGTLLFQDLCVVPMVLIVPLLGGGNAPGAAGVAVLVAVAKAAAVVVGTVAVSRLAVPRLLARVDASRSREVFLLTILAMCIGTAWLTSQAGLSLALGAFLGGMVVADTEYGHRAMGDILPLRDAFVSIFFVSLGMLFDVRVVAAQPHVVGALLLGFLVAKGGIATLAALVMRFPPRVAWLAGVGLAQFGEFGFVLVKLGRSAGVVEPHAVQPLLAAGILSMFVTPLVVRAAPHVTAGERLLAPLQRVLGVRSIDEAAAAPDRLRDHVVIVGYGLAGRLACTALEACGVARVVLELNAANVRSGRAQGHPVFYADATSEEALGHAHLGDARLLVLLMNDPQAAWRVLDTARRVAPAVPVLMRSRYLLERQALLGMGAGDVVAEEVEGAVEVLARMLRAMEQPRNVIDACIAAAREGTQTTERTQTVPRRTVRETHGIGEMKVESAVVREGAPVLGRSPVELRLRSETGALVVGVRRGERLLDHPDPTERFQLGDVVYLVGTADAVRLAVRGFDPAPDE